MIPTPESLKLPTVSGESVDVQVNWTKGVRGRFLKLRVGNSEAIIPREAFIRAALLFGNEEEQESLLPTRHFTIRHLVKRIKVRLKRDFKQGDLLDLTVPFDVPLSDEAFEALHELNQMKK